MQADAHLSTTGETIPDEDTDDIPVFELERVNVKLSLNRKPHEVDFIYIQFAEIVEIYATMDSLAQPHPSFESIRIDKLLQAQLNDHFYAESRLRIFKERWSVFEINRDVIIVRSGDEGVQIVAQHSSKDRILHVSHQ